ncbi:primosomal protein N' [Ampullimonas aquatilis]|uniref:primosomal protein N' n=1 Tax=Ampullimonas aquatilis TaxID=1341549 RepID=UPI003C728F54
MTSFAAVALDTPVFSLVDYVYLQDFDLHTGDWVVVDFGTTQKVGIVWQLPSTQPPIAVDKVRPIVRKLLGIAPLKMDWQWLIEFAAKYYQRGIGEVAIPAIPAHLRRVHDNDERTLKRVAKLLLVPKTSLDVPAFEQNEAPVASHALTQEQIKAVEAIASIRQFQTFLLQGITGSGKTEVYCESIARVLAQADSLLNTENISPSATEIHAQALVLVPEINLTPQLEGVFRSRFPNKRIVSLHSGLAEGERARSWLAAHTGMAQIVLGTRLAILASFANLQMIVVDEEHDPSYKQQEGLRYSARDLAVFRGKQLNVPVVLGSATPSLESWYRAKSGDYQLLQLTQRPLQTILPVIRLVDSARHPAGQSGLSEPLIAAIRARLAKQEQVLIFLNRRGYAPVMSCEACGWVGGCTRCSAHMVWHKRERLLRCHHCGLEARLPRACPTCGNQDLQSFGRGTERIEETLAELFAGARIARIDADTTRKKGSAQILFDSVHGGEVDILVGTQMVAKGHDFRNITLVAALNVDSALYAADFRASERLFAQLMQVAGRAGRSGKASEVLIQTRYPEHPLFASLAKQDYAGYAHILLAERRIAQMPPYIYQTILRAEAKTVEAALAWLQAAKEVGEALAEQQGLPVTFYDAVPMTLVRLAHIERAQLLIESANRAALQKLLPLWRAGLVTMKGRMKWQLEVDPLGM